ncbi:MAG: polysaccharide deacetylase family protein [Armatimonadota bacterium]
MADRVRALAAGGETEGAMRVISLLYHDVVYDGAWESSGFCNPGSGRYKLDGREFAAHLRAIAGAVHGTPSLVSDLSQPGAAARLLLTFDDGGVSAHSVIADLLEGQGWRGHFFVTAQCIGKAGFLTAEHIRDLRRRGHVIGSHSYSHPDPMAKLPRQALIEEWANSAYILADILGEPVRAASVPGGYYSRIVATAAAEAGITTLFNSEPVTRGLRVGDCTVLGRYTIMRGMSPAQAADLARARPEACARQWLIWNGKGLLKFLGGGLYLRLRDHLTARD